MRCDVKLVTLVIFLIFVSNVFSQSSFVPHTIVGGEYLVNGSYSICPIDIDGDGDQDVVAPSGETRKLVWFENEGDQNFIIHIIATEISGLYSVHAVDLDKDNDIDIIAGEYSSIIFYENDGNQNFTPNIFSIVCENFSWSFGLWNRCFAFANRWKMVNGSAPPP